MSKAQVHANKLTTKVHASCISHHKVIKIQLNYLYCLPPLILLKVTIKPHCSSKQKPYALNIKLLHSHFISFHSSGSTGIQFNQLFCVSLSFSSYIHKHMWTHALVCIHTYTYTPIKLCTSRVCCDPPEQPSSSHLPVTQKDATALGRHTHLYTAAAPVTLPQLSRAVLRSVRCHSHEISTLITLAASTLCGKAISTCSQQALPSRKLSKPSQITNI